MAQCIYKTIFFIHNLKDRVFQMDQKLVQLVCRHVVIGECQVTQVQMHGFKEIKKNKNKFFLTNLKSNLKIALCLFKDAYYGEYSSAG